METRETLCNGWGELYLECQRAAKKGRLLCAECEAARKVYEIDAMREAMRKSLRK